MLLAGLAAMPSVKADEGMCTLYNLPQAVYSQMQAQGFELPYDDIYHGKDAVAKAVVSFSGYCTGVVVSPDGLVFTNHHCGFEAIRSHSTVEHDYMLNGFYAKSFSEELPNKNMFVSFTVAQEDVTQRLVDLGLDSKKREEKAALIDSLANAMTDQVKAKDKSLHVEIDAYYEGNRYYATTYRMFTDLRLVFTVPKSMGKFGGETDNWMWPRQTCDFSVFRIYADPETNDRPNIRRTTCHTAPNTVSRVAAGLRAGLVLYDHWLSRLYQPLPLVLRHQGATRRRQRHKGAEPWREAADNEKAHGQERGRAH